MNDTITLYYYTAWNGFAWQGCDEATAKSLQGYMEATRTLPKSSADEPPFGGAVPCKISGQIGVAVYRYLTRKKGDMSGRDSLYIALAFIPLDVGCVDFARILELPQLSVPRPGELRPERISVSEQGLGLQDEASAPETWLDGDIVGTVYHVLKGKAGLRRLSALFFSKYTQLGFLNAVFRSDKGIEDLVSTQTYRVYPEVSDVVAASKALKTARGSDNRVLGRGHKAVKQMEAALARLDSWCGKLPGYTGLTEYYSQKLAEKNDDDCRLRDISAHVEKLASVLKGEKDGDPAWRQSIERSAAEQYVELAEDVVSVPVLDHETYTMALKSSLKLMRVAAECLGTLEGRKKAVQANADMKKAKEDLADAEKNLKNVEAEKAVLEKKIETLEKKIETLEKEKENLERGMKDLERQQKEKTKEQGPSQAEPIKSEAGKGLRNDVLIDSGKRKKPWERWVDVAFTLAMIVAVLLLVALAFAFIGKVFPASEGKGVSLTDFGVVSVTGTVSSVSNAVPVQTEGVEKLPEAQNPTGVVDMIDATVRKGKEGSK